MLGGELQEVLGGREMVGAGLPALEAPLAVRAPEVHLSLANSLLQRKEDSVRQRGGWLMHTLPRQAISCVSARRQRET